MSVPSTTARALYLMNRLPKGFPSVYILPMEDDAVMAPHANTLTFG